MLVTVVCDISFLKRALWNNWNAY